jgi:NAD(P)H-dependent flavin oxidoreductase YrpB (nitropropane dioxygenase family)
MMAGMNPASTVELTIAVHKAGAFPCVASWAYLNQVESDPNQPPKFKLDIQSFRAALDKFKVETGGMDLMLTLGVECIYMNQVIRMIEALKPKFVEIVSYSGTGDRLNSVISEEQIKIYLEKTKSSHSVETKEIRQIIFKESIQRIRNAGCKTLLRATGILGKIPENGNSVLPLFDGIVMKGKESGGLSNGGVDDVVHSVYANWHSQRLLTPNIVCIPSGGIGTPDDVKRYIDAGAEAVMVGTLLAASIESPLSEAVKLKMVQAKSSDLSNKNTDLFTEKEIEARSEKGQIVSHQSALVFGKIADKDDRNANRSLRIGISGQGDRGHVYAGTAIDHVNEIKLVKDIVEYLVSKL